MEEKNYPFILLAFHNMRMSKQRLLTSGINVNTNMLDPDMI